MGSSWELPTYLRQRIYTCIIIPICTYAVPTWFEVLILILILSKKKNQDQLRVIEHNAAYSNFSMSTHSQKRFSSLPKRHHSDSTNGKNINIKHFKNITLPKRNDKQRRPKERSKENNLEQLLTYYFTALPGKEQNSNI